jgi:hypothetical protein
MKIDIDIQPQGNYLLARYRGPDSLEISRNIMQRIIEACDEHKCFDVLVLAYIENPLSTLENYDLAAMFTEVGFSSKHRMAWVDQNPDTYDSTYFAETILHNRGFSARLFREVGDAKQWLLSDTTD